MRNLKMLAATAAAVLVIGGASFWFYSRTFLTVPDADCGLADKPGERISVRQGTVAAYGGTPAIRLGVVSVKDGKASLSLRSEEGGGSTLNTVLGACENVEFRGYRIYVLSAAGRPELPFLGTGSGNDSVSVFITREP